MYWNLIYLHSIELIASLFMRFWQCRLVWSHHNHCTVNDFIIKHGMMPWAHFLNEYLLPLPLTHSIVSYFHFWAINPLNFFYYYFWMVKRISFERKFNEMNEPKVKNKSLICIHALICGCQWILFLQECQTLKEFILL